MYQALYRKYRPKNFDEVWGQGNVVRILKNQLSNNRTSHAYIFSGIRGTGKTSIARIFAKALNCTSDDVPCGECESCKSFIEGSNIDVFEIDAASNNGVENIRDINEELKFSPRGGAKRVYIIDEVHMLSSGAFNALLKSLEEPPEHIVFILATTEIHKLPATILSRCLKLDFKRVSIDRIVEGILDISKKEGFEIDPEACKLIAYNGDGSVRDSLTILEQVLNYSGDKITKEDVLSALGRVGEDELYRFMDAFLSLDVEKCLSIIDSEVSNGKDSVSIIRSLIQYFRNMIVLNLTKNSNKEIIMNMSEDAISKIEKQAKDFDLKQLNEDILSLSKVLEMSRWSKEPRLLLEAWIISSLYERDSLEKTSELETKEEKKELNNVKKEDEDFNLGKFENPKLNNIWIQCLRESGVESDELLKLEKFTKLIDISSDKFKVVAKNKVIGKLLKDNLGLVEPLLAEMLEVEKSIVIGIKE